MHGEYIEISETVRNSANYYREWFSSGVNYDEAFVRSIGVATPWIFIPRISAPPGFRNSSYRNRQSTSNINRTSHEKAELAANAIRTSANQLETF